MKLIVTCFYIIVPHKPLNQATIKQLEIRYADNNYS